MRTITSLLSTLLVLVLTILVPVCCGVSSEDFPGGQDEEEMHVYKKYARYPLYFYTYRSPHLSDGKHGPADEDWNPDREPTDADSHALSQFESLPQRNIADKESFSKLQQILLNDLNPEIPVPSGGPVVFSGEHVRRKKSSVSWLLAAAIRMCQKYPGQCLKKDGKMDYKGMVDDGR